MNAFDAISEKSLGTPTDTKSILSSLRLSIPLFQEVNSDDCEMVVKVGGFKPWDTHVRDLLRGCFMVIRVESGMFHVMWGMEWSSTQ